MGAFKDWVAKLGGRDPRPAFRANTRTVQGLARQAGLAAEKAVETELATGAQEPHAASPSPGATRAPRAALAAPGEPHGGIPGSLTGGHVPGTSYGGPRGPLPGTEGAPPGGG
jgi:hypothetical protein